MQDTVPITIEVDSTAATALHDAATRARVGRLISRMFRPPTEETFAAAIADLKAEAFRRGLTDEIIDEEACRPQEGAAESRNLI